jgi:hypothetical protein
MSSGLKLAQEQASRASLPEFSGLVAAVVAQQTDRSLERFFSHHKCSHIYLDVGTNLGVQIRKLAEPHKYPGAPMLEHFRALFGPSPWCHVCAIGFEPNPAHSQRLHMLETRLRAAHAPPFFLFRAAASDADSALGFLQRGYQGDPSRHLRTQNLKLASSLESGANAYNNASGPRNYVPTVDLARVVHAAHASLIEKHGGQRAGSKLLMKLDVEGSETSILLHLVRSQALCLIDTVKIEWHRAVPKWMVPEGNAGVSVLGNVTEEVQQLFQRVLGAKHRDCRTTLDRMDDETFYRDGQGWPSKNICTNSP